MSKSVSLKKTLAIFAMASCFSMLFLNESGAIAVTFPKMQQMLGLSNHAINWVMNSFLLTAAILLLLGGKLADHFGRVKIFSIGLVIFLLASGLCGAAQNSEMMIWGRVLQAIGASLIYPSGTALVSLRFPDKEFTKAFGTVMGISYFFVAFGTFVGGFFTEYLTWRWLFWINVPVSLICFVLTLYSMPKSSHPLSKTPLDFFGLIIYMIGLGALIFALMQAPIWGWDNPLILVLFIVAFIGLVTFIKYELKIKHPLLDIRLFKNRGFLAGNIIFPCTAACFTGLVFWAIWLQQTFNFSPLVTGIAMIPATVISLFMLGVSGAWGGKVGPRIPILLGSVLLIIAMYWIAGVSLLENYWYIFVGFVLFGFATPLIIPNSIGVIMSSVEARLHGIASGVYLTLQHVAFTLGFAVLAAVISTYNETHLKQLLSNHPEITNNQMHLLLAGKNTIPGLSQTHLLDLQKAGIDIYTHAFSWGMAALGVFAIIALIVTIIFIPKNKAT